MIQHTSQKFKIIFYLLFFTFFSCKKVSKENSTAITEKKEDRKERRNTWNFEKIFSVSPQSNYSCPSEKYKQIVFGVESDSVFINNKYTDDVYMNSVSSQSFFKKNYLYEAYKKRLKEELNIDLPEQIKTIRNKKAYDPSSPLDQYFQDAFFIGDYMFFEVNGCIICFKNSTSKAKQVSTERNSFIKEDHPEKVSLPFSFYQYFKDQYSDAKYPSYEITSGLIDYLKSKNYEGESYRAFVLRSDDQFQYVVVDMSRGDSDYFVLITAQNGKIMDSREIGSVGDENPITFKITPEFTVEKYKGNTADAAPFEQFKIDQKGKVVKL